jgi:hypothetical protein
MLSTSTTSTSQLRLKRFIRQPEKLAGRQITPKGLEAVAVIDRYRFIPSSLLVRLMSGAQRNNYRHLQTLFHHGVVNRFCLPKYGGPGEFIYYLDSQQSLLTLIQEGLLPGLTDEDRRQKQEIIRLNREKAYHQLHRDADSQGRVLYIQHELMVSRFHAMLELASQKLAGKVSLEVWKQGTELWSRVEVPKLTQDRESGAWIEQSATELLPHRPDAFFTLHFPGRPEGKDRANFFYEADRGTENTTRFKLKLRAHWHYVVKQNRQRAAPYNVHAIRAVLTESTSSNWAQGLREAAQHPIVSPKPSPLFWFTTSELFTKPAETTGRPVPLYLDKPETVFTRIWANPTEQKLFNLAD